MNVALKTRSTIFMTLVITMCLALAFSTQEVNASKNEESYNGVVIPKNEKTVNGSKSKSSTIFINPSITVDDSEVFIEGKVKYNNKMSNVSLNGPIYPVGKGEEGESELFGDLQVNKGSDVFNFLQLQILKKPTSNEVIGKQQYKNNKSLVNILLEHKETKEVAVFQIDIKDDLLNKISNTAMNNSSELTDQELYKITGELLRAPANKRESIEDPETSGTDSGSSDQFSAFSTTISEDISRSELNKLKNDLVEAGQYQWLDFSDYNLPESLFTTEGNFTDVSGNNRLYGNGYEDPYGTFIVGISHMDRLNDNYSGEIRLQLSMKFSLTVLYDPEFGQIKLRHKDRGMKLDDIDLAIGKLKDDNIFNEQGVNGSLMKPGNVTGTTVKILLSKVPYIKEVSSVWYDLQAAFPKSTLELGNEQAYWSSIENQEKYYDDEIIRNLSSSSEDLYMENSEHYYYLKGTVTDEDDDGFSWSWAWDLTYAPNF